MILYSPLSKDIYPLIQTYINEIPELKNVEKVFVYLDIQNHSVAFTDRGVEEYISNVTFSQVFNDILYTISNIVDGINSIGFKPHVFIYSDVDRNLFNTNLIKEWKENRNKEMTEVNETACLKDDSQKFISRMIKFSLKSLRHIINTSFNSTIVLMKYIDSDFFPQIVINYTKDSDKILHIILSGDHDYIHSINNPFVIRHSSYRKRLYKNYPMLESMYNRHVFLQKSLNIKDINEAKYICSYYQIYHALSGDSTDSVKPIVDRMSYKKWIKKLKFENPVNIEVDRIMNNELSFENVDISEVKKRLFIFDFNITASLILGMIDDKFKNSLYNDELVKLDSRNLDIIKENVDIIKETVFSERYKPDNLDLIENKFGINSSFTKSLWT